MRGALALVRTVPLSAMLTATAAMLTHEVHARSAEPGQPTLVTYHRTGAALMNLLMDECFAGLGFQFNHGGHLSLPAVHWIRDPKSVVRSAYDYNKVALSGWVKDINRHFLFLENDPVLSPTLVLNETYQQYLNRVPFEMGVRAEFRRTSTDLERMIESADICAANPDSCKQVCLEALSESSLSYQETWSDVLDFLGVNQSVMSCINRHDMLNPNYLGSWEFHATTSKWEDTSHVFELFANFDENFMNHSFRNAAEKWGCSPRSVRRELMLTTLYVDNGEVEMEGRADQYA